ncbi:MAG: class I SAM-dependent methyltransferase [Candidatus Sumerlaeia bacterium]
MAILALTYALETSLADTALREIDLQTCKRLCLVHRSNADHLGIFLEHALTERPTLMVDVVSHWSPDVLRGEYDNMAHLEEKHGVRLFEVSDWSGTSGPWDMVVMLYSAAATVQAKDARALRKVFAATKANQRIIINGDGSIWKGDMLNRLKRKVLVRMLGKLAPMRDRIEQSLIDKRLLPDPGYARKNPPPAELPAFRKHRMILALPTPIEQCKETGNIRKPELLRQGIQDAVYAGGYHFTPFTDRREDHEGRLRRWQQKRLRNMKMVGLIPEEFPDGARALDVGCGAGMFAGLLADRGFDTLGIDLSETSIRKARQTFPKARFEIQRAEELRDAGNQYDLIVASHVLEHMKHDGKFLETLRPLLGENGRLYVEVPWADREALAARPGWCRQMDHYREYSTRGFYQTLAASGYEVLAHEQSFSIDPEEPFQFACVRAMP